MTRGRRLGAEGAGATWAALLLLQACFMYTYFYAQAAATTRPGPHEPGGSFRPYHPIPER